LRRGPPSLGAEPIQGPRTSSRGQPYCDQVMGQWCCSIRHAEDVIKGPALLRRAGSHRRRPRSSCRGRHQGASPIATRAYATDSPDHQLCRGRHQGASPIATDCRRRWGRRAGQPRTSSRGQPYCDRVGRCPKRGDVSYPRTSSPASR